MTDDEWTAWDADLIPALGGSMAQADFEERWEVE